MASSRTVGKIVVVLTALAWTTVAAMVVLGATSARSFGEGWQLLFVALVGASVLLGVVTTLWHLPCRAREGDSGARPLSGRDVDEAFRLGVAFGQQLEREDSADQRLLSMRHRP